MDPRGEIERYFQLDEQLGRAGRSEAERLHLERAREGVADGIEAAFRADADRALDRLEREGQVEVGHEGMTFGQAKKELPHEDFRDRRALLERGIGRRLGADTSPFARRIEAAHATASALGEGSPLALREKLTGTSPRALAPEAEQLLRESEDPFRDVLGYAFGRIAPALRPLPGGDGRRHDLEHLATAPWLRKFFSSRSDASRWLFASSSSKEVDLSLSGGLDGYGSALEQAGASLRASAFSSEYATEDSRLEDPVVVRTAILLGRQLLCDERWLRAEVRCSHADAREIARVAALVRLGALRKDCARLPLAPLPYDRGLDAQVRDVWRAGLTDALFVEHDPFWPLLDLESPHELARALLAWQLEVALSTHLRERFDDDWFRNPAAGDALRALLESPTTAKALAARVGNPELAEAGRRLVRVLAA